MSAVGLAFFGFGRSRRCLRLTPTFVPEVLATAILDETNVVAVGIDYVHLPVAPTLIGRFECDPDPFRDEILMQRINVLDQKKHRHTLRRRKTMKRAAPLHRASSPC